MLRRLLLGILVSTVVLITATSVLAYWFLAGDGVRLAIEGQASAWLGQPVRIGRASVDVLPRLGIQLGDVRVGDPVRLALGDVHVSTALRALLSRTIDEAAVTVADSRIELPLPFGRPAGDPGSSPVPADGTERRAIRIASIRAISLDDIVVVSRGREVRVSADFSLDDDRLTVRRFSARSGVTTLDAEGEVDLAPRIDARLTATANELDVDELLALVEAFTPPPPPDSGREGPSSARIAAHVSARTATAGRMQVAGFTTELALDGDRVALSGLTFQLFGGRYEGSLNARLGSELAVTFESRLENLDVAQLAAFGGSPDTISGTLGGTGTFRGSGADLPAVWRTLRGTGTIAILDGAIRRLNLVRTVVLFFGRPAPDAAAGSDRFDRIDASFTLANRVFRAEDFSLRSPDADITGSGSLDAATDALDGRFDLVLSPELSKQAGTDLIRFTREGDRVVVPARIGGTLAAPRLAIDAAAAAGRGLRNEVERRLKGLLDGIGRSQDSQPTTPQR
jgi:uncharacterized protein involved in outer membrane biogenesis